MSRPAWKAVLSEAVVTRDKVQGKRCRYGCLEGSTLYWAEYSRGTAFQAVVLPFKSRDYVPGYDRFA